MSQSDVLCCLSASVPAIQGWHQPVSVHQGPHSQSALLAQYSQRRKSNPRYQAPSNSRWASERTWMRQRNRASLSSAAAFGLLLRTWPASKRSFFPDSRGPGPARPSPPAPRGRLPPPWQSGERPPRFPAAPGRDRSPRCKRKPAAAARPTTLPAANRARRQGRRTSG